MATGTQLYQLAMQHIGEQYVDNCPDAPLSDPTYKGPWDCAEFVTWCVYQVSRIKVGHRSGAGGAYTGYWKDDMDTLCVQTSRKKAKRIKGAIFLRFPTKKKLGHIAISDGDGGTVEAMDVKNGVRKGRIIFRDWDAFLLIKGITY